MKHINFYFTDPRHHLVKRLLELDRVQKRNFTICFEVSDFADDCVHILVAWGEIIADTDLISKDNVFVLHCGNLPFHRGWSPLTWLLKNGETEINVNLITLAEKVDQGDIIDFRTISVAETDDFEAISRKMRDAMLSLSHAIGSGICGEGFKQEGHSSYFPRLTEVDHDISESSDDWLKILHACRCFDSERFPPYFNLCGERYSIVIKKR